MSDQWSPIHCSVRLYVTLDSAELIVSCVVAIQLPVQLLMRVGSPASVTVNGPVPNWASQSGELPETYALR